MNKKLRFEVFKRDSFTCRYCGRKPTEDAVLEVDHIIPKSQGGTNEIENLITSCFDCNRGKGKRMLTELTPEMQKNAELLKERKEQLKAFYKYQKDIENITNEAIAIVSDYWSELANNEYTLKATAKITIKNFLKTFTITEIKEAMEISTKINDLEQRFKYFCGIMHNKKLEKTNPELHELIRYWKGQNKGSGYYKKEGLEILLNGREESGHYSHGLEGSREIIDVIYSKPRSSYYGALVDYLNDEEDINKEVAEYWEKKQFEKEKREWEELQQKNELENPLLFQAINHYTYLTNDYLIAKLLASELNTLIQKFGINDTLKMIDYAIISRYSETVLHSLANNKNEDIKGYEEWLKTGYKNYISLCKEARKIKEDDNIENLKRTLLILSAKFSFGEAEALLDHVMAAKGELLPQYFEDPDALYKEWAEEMDAIREFSNVTS